MTSSDRPQDGSSGVEASLIVTKPGWGMIGSEAKREGVPWSLLASFIAHFLLGLVVLQFVPNLPKPVPADVDSIAVEIVSPRNANPAVPAPIATKQAAPDREAAAIQPSETHKVLTEHVDPDANGNIGATPLVAASQLYAEKMLASPKGKKVRKALRKLATEEHMIQLCNLEAMEQVQRWNKMFRPDYVVAYAISDPRIAPTAIDAEGGAFRSGRRWYSIRFQCVVTADISKVVSFAFAVGNEIPKQEWRSRNLAPDDGPDD